MHSNGPWVKLKPLSLPFDCERAGIVLNPASIQHLESDLNCPIWIQVYSFVYRVIFDENFPVGSAGLSTYDFRKLPTGSAKIAMKIYDKGFDNKIAATQMNMDVVFLSSSTPAVEHINLEVQGILSLACPFFLHQFFREHQKLTLEFEHGALQFNVTSLNQNTLTPNVNAQTFGYVNDETLISLTTTDKSRLKLIYGRVECEDAVFNCSISATGSTLTSSDTLPVLIPATEIRRCLSESFPESYTQVPGAIVLRPANVGTLHITVDSVTSPTHPTLNLYSVKLTNAHAATFTSLDPRVKVIHGEAKIPKGLLLSIEKAEIWDEPEVKYPPPWIAVDELLKGLKALPHGVVTNQTVTLPITQGYALVKVDTVFCRTVTDTQDHHWKLNDDTDIEFITPKTRDYSLIATLNAKPLKQIRMGVRVPSWIHHTSVKRSHLLQSLESLPIMKWAKNHVIYLKVPGKDYSIEIKVDSMEFQEESTQRYPFLGSITKDTQVDFYSGSSCVWVETKSAEEILSDFGAHAMENGIGGVAKKLSQFLKTLVQTNKVDSPHLPEEMPRGVLLYGPTGTGKTKVADFMGQLLGIPDRRIFSITGSEILQNWHKKSDQTQENFLKLCGIEDDATPLKRMLIIDSFHLIAPLKFNEDDQTLVSLSSVLSKLASIRNLFVIGITTDADNVSTALRRPGFFYPHFQMELPDLEARKEILTIFLREKSLENDVSIDLLAKLTDGYTGAQIQEMIVKAAHINWLKKPKQTDDSNKIAMNSFTDAIKTTLKFKKEADPAWLGMML